MPAAAHPCTVVPSFGPNVLVSPNKLLRSFPALQADAIKRISLTIIRKLPSDVYAEIVNHAL